MKTNLLATALAIVLGTTCADTMAQSAPATPAQPKPATQPAARKDVAVEEFDKLRKDPKYVVLDVRTEREFNGGHIPGAVHIDVNSPEFVAKAKELAKDKTLLVHCAAGRRSVTACDKLEKAGLKGMYNLEGGLGAWSKAGKPVEK